MQTKKKHPRQKVLYETLKSSTHNFIIFSSHYFVKKNAPEGENYIYNIKKMIFAFFTIFVYNETKKSNL